MLEVLCPIQKNNCTSFTNGDGDIFLPFIPEVLCPQISTPRRRVYGGWVEIPIFHAITTTSEKKGLIRPCGWRGADITDGQGRGAGV